MEAAEGCPGSRPALRRQPRASASAARRGARAVAERPPAVAFFAVIYYTGLRPEEAVSLRKESITLPPLVRNPDTGTWQEPPDNWGELRFCSAAPEAGAEWTDDGRQRDHRHLKSRPVGEWRRVPVAPPLTRILRAHLREFRAAPGSLVFAGVQGRELASIT